ncbi:right-handed parallel beta-helix repeat-containing protein, partial [Carboxylicivirga sediminis]
MIKLLHIIKSTAVVGLLLLSTSAFAQRIYVKTDGVPYSSIAEHADWNVATHDLQAAINALAAEGTEDIREVWVAKGIYFPTEIFNGDASDNRNKSFILKNNVRVVGGFAGTETDEDQRSNFTYDLVGETIGENATILDGDLGSERSYHVVFLGNLSNETAVLEGVIVRNGIANAASAEVGFEDSNYFGGGIYARNGGTFIECTLIDNRGGLGGGAYCVSSVFDKCNFVNNRGWYSSSEYNGKGGGLYVHEESLITNCEFIGNLADNDGGGIFSSGSSFTNITFSGNTAGNNGGAICTYADGATYNGGVYTTCTFINNSADGNGGAIYALPGGGSFDDCMISENNANRGGGVYLNTGASLLSSTIFENTVVTSHAGVYNVGGLIDGCTIENNNGTGVFLDGGVAKKTIIKGNYGASTGSGVLMSGAAELNTCHVYDNESERGGGVYANDGALIVNSLINNNTAELSGGGLYINGVVAVINTTVTRNKVLSVTGLGQGVLCNAPSTPSGSGEFVNSIICSNEGSNPSGTEIDYAPDVTATFQYTAVESNANSGESNVELDPSAEVFVMPTTFAGAASTPEEEAEFETADWRLTLLSPCFNGGTPDITGLELPENDLLGNGRVYKTRVDMGAIENVYYDVTIASTGLGATSPATDLSVLPGDDLEIIMTPVEGNGVSDVVVNSESVYDQMIDNGDGTFSYTISAIGEDKAVNVTFLPYYTVTATAVDGGSISPLTSVILEGRSSDEFTITPDAGYKLTSLLLDGEEVQWEDNAGVLTYTISTVTADASLVAAFTEYFTVTATAGTGGAITPPTSEVLINESSDEFTITPDAGYKLTSLQLGGEEVQWED